MVARNLGVRRRGFQERELNVLELDPVNDVSVKLYVELIESVLNILDGQLRIPAVIQMNSQWPQAQLFDFVSNIGAIHSAAHADHAVILFICALALDVLYDRVEPLSSILARKNG